MMRRCSKCFNTRPVVLTVFGRHPLHFCASCARLEAARYRPALTVRSRTKPFLNALPLRLKFSKEVH
jgi:hypothetical protein